VILTKEHTKEDADMDKDEEKRQSAPSLLVYHGLRPSQFRKAHAKHGERQRQKCEVCGKSMRITRRQPHPTRGPQYELQTFTCPHCENIQQASTQSLGAVSVNPR
jgi:hypothetical protein